MKKTAILVFFTLAIVVIISVGINRVSPDAENNGGTQLAEEKAEQPQETVRVSLLMRTA